MLFGKGVHYKRKRFDATVSFLLEYTSFHKRDKNVLTKLPALKVYSFPLTLSAWQTKTNTCANSVDPDETVRSVF